LSEVIEEKFQCVFGLGECKVLKWLSDQMKVSALSFKVGKPTEIPGELEPFLVYMESLLQKMSSAIAVGNLGYFCIACIKLRKEQTRLIEKQMEEL
jgi:hypothetical protein